MSTTGLVDGALLSARCARVALAWAMSMVLGPARQRQWMAQIRFDGRIPNKLGPHISNQGAHVMYTQTELAHGAERLRDGPNHQ